MSELAVVFGISARVDHSMNVIRMENYVATVVVLQCFCRLLCWNQKIEELDK